MYLFWSNLSSQETNFGFFFEIVGNKQEVSMAFFGNSLQHFTNAL